MSNLLLVAVMMISAFWTTEAINPVLGTESYIQNMHLISNTVEKNKINVKHKKTEKCECKKESCECKDCKCARKHDWSKMKEAVEKLKRDKCKCEDACKCPDKCEDKCEKKCRRTPVRNLLFK